MRHVVEEPSRDLTTLHVRGSLEEACLEVPDGIFIVHGQETITYSDFNARVNRAAGAWWELGVRKGDRVAFMLENRPEFLESWLGLAQIGGILVSINTRWQAPEVSYFLSLTEPTIALVGKSFVQLFRSAIPSGCSLHRVLTLEYSGSNPDLRMRAATSGAMESSDDFSRISRAVASRAPTVELGSADDISFISTSGTTGRPKAVMQTHGNYVLTGEAYAYWMQLRSCERLYLCLPLFHINSQAYTVMGAIAARATIVLVEKFSASRFWPDMAEHGVNVFNYVGSMLAVLMNREPGPQETRHRVRVAYGGPALAGARRAEAENRFGLTLISGIGMSETTFGLIESLSGERRPGSLGRVRQHPDPRLLNESRVVGDDDVDVSDGEVGELIFRSPMLMKGYFRDVEQTASTIRNGWLYTGDLVTRDKDGFFYFVDRKKDIIRVRGENVSSAEVEHVLSEHPAVYEAAVVGVPSDLTEEDVAAFVVVAPGASPDLAELMQWCRDRLAAFKVPTYAWVIESLPKTETQRTEKHRLRELAKERLLVAERGEGSP